MCPRMCARACAPPPVRPRLWPAAGCGPTPVARAHPGVSSPASAQQPQLAGGRARPGSGAAAARFRARRSVAQDWRLADQGDEPPAAQPATRLAEARSTLKKRTHPIPPPCQLPACPPARLPACLQNKRTYPQLAELATLLEEGALEKAAKGMWGASSKPNRYEKWAAGGGVGGGTLGCSRGLALAALLMPT